MRAELRCLFLTVSLVLVASQGFGQTGTGAYPFSTMDNRGADSINVGNLNIHLDIPVFHKAGRGLPFTYDLVYDGLVWQPSSVSGSPSWNPVQNFGWTAQTQVQTGYVSYSKLVSGCDLTDSRYTVVTDFVYHDAWGVSHPFDGSLEYDPTDCDAGTTNSFTSSADDNSGLTLKASALHGYVETTVITTRNGTVLNVPTSAASSASTTTDTNGNQISVDTSGHYTDTLGVIAMTVAGTAPGNVTLTYPNASGGTASYTIKYSSYNIQTNFGCSGVGEYSASGVSLVSEIDRADGTKYSLTYEPTPGGSGTVTGRLAAITLPTGGIISYAYSGGCNGNGMNSDGTVGTLTRTTSDGTRTYTRSTVNANATSTDVQDEQGKHTVYKFTIAGNNYYETHRQVYDGNTSAPLLLDRFTCWNGITPTPYCDGAAFTLPITQALTTSSYNGEPASSTMNTYDSSGSMTSSSLQDYGGAVLENLYISYNALEEPTDVKMVDSARNTIAETQYGYDQTTPTTTSGIPQHIPGSSAGNQTTAQSWISTNGSWLATTTAYWDTGVPVSATDPTGTTQFGYDPTQAFTTQTTLPTPSSGVTLSTAASYDQNSGVQQSATGMNAGQTVQVTQYDSLLRPLTVSMPDGGQTTYTYSANQTGVSSKLNPSQSSDQETFYDGYGRVIRTATFNGSTWYLTDSCYDAAGRLQSQSVPYSSATDTGAEVCSGNVTSYTYDALGRVTKITNSDGKTLYKYNQRAIEVTDVNGVQKITQTDALGRTTAICEISGNALQGDAPQSCGLDIAGTGFLTSYTYDLANHKIIVTQGAQTRVFQTDSLGRTILTQEPESGQTTYSYAYNSTGLQVTRTRPRVNQTNPATTTTTITQYDSVGRPVSITYNDGTPTKTFSYDASAGWTNFTQNNLKGQISLAQAGNWAGTTFSYDVMGRVAEMHECLPSGCGNPAYDKALPYTYDLAGNMASSGDGAGVTTTYTYSDAAQVTGMSSSLSGPTYPASLLSNVQYGPGGPNTYSLGNGINVYSTYDNLNRLTGRWFCTGSAPAQMYCPGGTQMYAYQTSWQGSRSTSSSDTAQSQGFWYGYDDFNRLSSSTSNYGTPQSFTYQYDRYGNRWAQTVTQGSGPSPSLTFNKTNNQISTPGDVYDAAGDLINDGTHSYSYDAEGNLTQVDGGSTAAYTYNALNQRVRIAWSGGVQEIVFGVDGKRTSTWDGNSRALLEGVAYWGGQALEYYANGYAHYLHTNWVGTMRMVTNNTGGVDGEFTSLPFGDAWTVTQGTSNDGYQFAGLDLDTTDLEHAQFRQISTTQGRWMSPDPYNGSYDMGDPQSFNRYAYVLNSPLGYLDQLGLGDPKSCGKITGTTDIGYTIVVYTYLIPCDPGSSNKTVLSFPNNSPGGNAGASNGGASSSSNAPDNGQPSVKGKCLAQYYNSTGGKIIDFGSVLGLVPGWSPNASRNFKEITTLGALKYGVLATTSAAANKWDVVTIQTINTTTTIGSSAGPWLSLGLKWLGKAAKLGTISATGLDILAHAGCDTVARQQSGQMTPTPVSGGSIP